ncbi:MAG TPA: hypothetical protein VMV59_02880 [Candidatus Dormibacteraeota bacterium]|nr:hypothetical protein [Candidatus Dormibacteraeota bacterium]
MRVVDVFHVCLAVIASLGGGGLIVLGLSRYCGQIFANWALARQKQEYAQLNLKFQGELDRASKRLQVELNRLEHLHKLRTQTEFEKMFALWKQIALLHVEFRRLPGSEDLLSGTDDQKSEYRRSASMRFVTCVNETFRIWNEEQLAISKTISDAAAKVISIAFEEQEFVFRYPDPFIEVDLIPKKARTDFFARRAANASTFGDKAMDLLDMMRKHLQAETSAERPLA